jgi:hypothetical protein
MLVGIGLIILGAMQYFVIARQVSIMDTQTNISRTQIAITETIERPFVFRKNIWIEYGLDDARWRFIIEWENAGNTAPIGLMLRPHCGFGAIDEIPPFHADYRTDPQATVEFFYVLGPKQSKKNGRCLLDQKEIDSARSDGKFFFIGGQAIYGDSFGKTHKTRFCEQYPVPTLPSDPKSDIEVHQLLGDPIFCWGYNCTDAECDAQDAYQDERRGVRPPKP